MSNREFDNEIAGLSSILDSLDNRAIEALRQFITSNDVNEKNRERALHRVRRHLMRALAELNVLSNAEQMEEMGAPELD